MRNKLNINCSWFFVHPSNRKLQFSEMNEIILEKLEIVKIKDINNKLGLNDFDVKEDFSINRSFRRGSTTHTQNSKIPNHIIESMNRWKKFERAKGRKAKLAMIETYSDIEQLIPTLIQYSANL